jgi:serine/threonine protein kinase
LFLLRSLQNKNIVRLVASYTQNGFCNLLFPVADCDLHDLLLSSHRPEWTTKSEEVIDSLCGLAKGLHHLHNFRPLAKSAEETDRITKQGYHHDIKLRNILVNGSRLILADFGLSRLKNAEEDTQTIWKSRPPTYSAPEACDPVTLQEKSVGRAYDIWSFGCVLSELATYALEGADAVKTFRKEREKEGIYGRDNCFHHEGVRSPAVNTWFREMEDRHRSSSLSLLFGISSKLLVGDPSKRPRSEEPVQEFEYLSLNRRLLTVLHNTSVMSNEAGRETISSVYLAKLTLERDRLRAWGYALGLESFNEKMRPWIRQTSENYDKIYLDLKNCSAELIEFINQTGQPEIQQRILAVLTSTNEALLLGLPESVTNVIENTFQLLTVSTGKKIQLLASLAVNSQTLDHMESTASERQNASRHHEAGLLAAARYMSLMLSAKDSLPTDGTVRFIEPSLICDYLRHNAYSTPISVRWYYRGFRENDKQRVLVEERSYDSKWTSVQDKNQFEDSGKEIFERIKELAKLFQMQPKPKSMRLLNCLGVFHLPASTKFGFVYEFPPSEGVESDQEPISLSDVIEHTKDPQRNPTLNDKFTLSHAIASCIYSLHLTGWLHKSIRSSNFIYFKEGNQDLTGLNICEPYLIGFQHSRQSMPGAYSDGSVANTERAVVHPSYQDGARFHSAFDYYSLGVILLEIALWRPIGKVIPPGTSADIILRLLLEHAAKYVPQRMGTGHCKVILACLNFYHNHNSENQESILLMKFQQEVLEKLQRAASTL